MKQRLLICSVLIALFATLAVGAAVAAATDQGLGSLTGSAEPEVGSTSAATCDGLTGYSDAMLRIGKRWIKGMRRDGLADRSTRTFTTAEWEDYATRAARLLADLRTIEPPVFATPWHAAMVDAARLKINFARSASLIGFDYTAEILATRVAATSTEVADARQEAATACADFATFSQEWDLLDGKASAATKSDEA